ncbi:MAG: hypothetical protein Q4G24_08965 [Paracoccus sp. (in: a-proteobacteria)]|uniref:hypothetical protein n=1 Tax=Paracoccus sp. TaxID=267 RepID=UPI0026DF8C46|nr:hypothetical protein [Paracoccus sp. (in: a-proteobacteria)]MDO5621584.1 hypothetical protein [Paracoccus sp. (in: a-proteobacteria)]
MDKETTDQSAPKRKNAPNSREERLRAALRANLARRKAQARGRADEDTPQGETEE